MSTPEFTPISSMDSSPLTSMPIIESQGPTVSIEIIHIPEQKGMRAWMAHMNRKTRRSKLLDKLRSLVF